MHLKDKTVVITGASGGLGRAMAIGFVRDGAHVVGFGRNSEGLDETRRLSGVESMHCVVGDLAKSEDVLRLFSEVKRLGRSPDVLINNAAVYPRSRFLEAPAEEFAQAMTINVSALALCCRLALPSMLERQFGRVVNVGTFAWLGPIPNSSAYSASKGAIRPLTKAIASEIDRAKHPDVLVNEFIPGVFRTGMSADGEDPAEVYPHLRHVVCLPSGGPSGRTYFKSDLLEEHPGIRSRITGILRRVLAR
jgi:NAD(P)-dependent dehydrogenase (short-subunit alcohol dehydrogenase family)